MCNFQKMHREKNAILHSFHILLNKFAVRLFLSRKKNDETKNKQENNMEKRRKWKLCFSDNKRVKKNDKKVK